MPGSWEDHAWRCKAVERRVYDSIEEAVGFTPLVRLSRLFPQEWVEVWAKIEFMNPMGSVKDRIARWMVSKALRDGRARPGCVVVENSSGNTAMGLAMMCILHGMKALMVVRRDTSPEKLRSLEALGVELHMVEPGLPPEHPASYNRAAVRLAERLEGSFFPDQHNDRENLEAHYRTTGPEIWAQMDGRVDYWVAGIGTGGTVCGVARYLKEKSPGVKAIAVEPKGSVFRKMFLGEKEPRASSDAHRIEGLGDEEPIGCPDLAVLDDVWQVEEGEAFVAARELALTEAVFAGASSGAAVCGVRRLIESLEEDRMHFQGPVRVVTLFPDSGVRYLSTIYDDEWMRKKGFIP